MARTKRRRRRRNPDLVEGVKTSALSVLNVEFIKRNAWVGGAGALAVVLLGGPLAGLLSKVNIPPVAGVDVNALVVSLGVATAAAVLGVAAGLVPGTAGQLIGKTAEFAASGAMITAFGVTALGLIGAFQSRDSVVIDVPETGYGAFTTMPLDLEGRVAQGMQGYGDYVKLHDVIPTITPTELDRAEAGVFGNSSYERLGDIYGSQRLGSFEREGNLGGFVDESTSYGITAQGNQQIADTAALDQSGMTGEGGGTIGSYGAYESFGAPGQGGGAGDFSPLWS